MELAAKTPKTLAERASHILNWPVIATIKPVVDSKVEPSSNMGKEHHTKIMPSNANPITLYLEVKY